MDPRLKETPRPSLQRRHLPALEPTDGLTESLAQERTDRRHMGFEDDDDDGDDDGVQVLDSLDMGSHFKTKVPHEGLEMEMDADRAHSRVSEDDLMDLKYDPDWRSKLKAAGCFFSATQSSTEDAVQGQKPPQAVIKGGYTYISDTGPAMFGGPNMAAGETDQPYLLHPTDCRLQSGDMENMNRSHELTQSLRHVNALYTQEYQNYYLHEAQQNQGWPAQRATGPRYASPKRQLDDIVERNKVTLGRQTDKHGSYMRMHTLRQETVLPVKKDVEPVMEAAIEPEPEESLDPETRWQQRTQQLKASQTNKTRKYQRSENPDLPPQKHVSIVDPQTQALTSAYHTLEPLFQENHFKAPSELLPSAHQEDHINATSPPRFTHRSPDTRVQFLPEGQQTSLQEPFFVCLEGLDNDLNLEKSLELHLRSPGASRGSSAYTVLPSIGKVYEEGPEMSLRSTFSAENFPQNEKEEKPEKQRIAYKTYTLRDYKQLLPEVKLQGLGPDYSAVEKTKMKRLRQYSEVIREQNKKISRVPFLAAKDPEGTDKKVPRMKALEYAKTIAKPRLPPQARPNERAPSDDIGELPSSFQDKTAFQLDTLENLRKRHEQEKKTVAHFRKFL